MASGRDGRMKRCKTCEHWRVGDPVEGWGSCKLAKSKNMQPVAPESLAVAFDSEGYMAELNTHHTFGCVQWERKGPQ